MILNSKTLAVILIVLTFGGIGISSALGWWQTTSDKTPAAYTEGEFAGQANPADIRGSYTFGDIANSFNVPTEILARAFNVADDPAFAVKDLEEIYADSPVEIGTASVRIFVAFYNGLPYDLTSAGETYLPQSAVDILNERATLTPEQDSWLKAHTVSTADSLSDPIQDSVIATSVPAESFTVKGKTTFGELIEWGVPKETIEGIIGAAIPDPAMTVKDYAAANGLDFETIKSALQTEADEIK